jgi:hypothetical protein
MSLRTEYPREPRHPPPPRGSASVSSPTAAARGDGRSWFWCRHRRRGCSSGCWGGAASSASPTVEVSGATGAEAAAVAELVDVPIGTPLARVDTEAVAARVRERITDAEVSVRRAWPSTLAVDIVLRTPAIVVKNPQGQLEVVDAEGVAFGVVKAAPKGVPVVTAVGARAPLARPCSRRSRC